MVTVLLGFCSLAVDLGRVQVGKTELRRATDAAARYAVTGLADSDSTVRTNAKAAATENVVDGGAFSLTNQNIEFVNWDSATRTYTTLGSVSGANGVRVSARYSVPLLFARVLGRGTCDVTAESIAVLVPATNVDQQVQGTANPFLAGMPPGSVASQNNPHNSADYAGTAANPKQSPQAVPMTVTPGQTLTFDSISGTAGHDPNLNSYNPDGQLDDIGHNTNSSENGISDMNAPINSLVGVFLSDAQPNLTAPPANLDFTTTQSRDFQTLQPALKQLFYIGDGLDSNGKVQSFVVPQGATRLFLATWDFYEWNNNYGYRQIKIIRPQQISIVK